MEPHKPHKTNKIQEEIDFLMRKIEDTAQRSEASMSKLKNSMVNASEVMGSFSEAKAVSDQAFNISVVNFNKNKMDEVKCKENVKFNLRELYSVESVPDWFPNDDRPFRGIISDDDEFIQHLED